MYGRGPASSLRSTVEAAGRSSAATRAYRTYAVDCPAGLIPGVLALYPNLGTQRPVACVRGRRSRVSGARPDGLAPQEPVYSWLLPTPACARTAVAHCHETDGRKPFERASSPPYRSLRSRLRTEAPRYRLLRSFRPSHGAGFRAARAGQIPLQRRSTRPEFWMEFEDSPTPLRGEFTGSPPRVRKYLIRVPAADADDA